MINASPGNLTPVFDAMLEKAMRLCGAAFGAVALYDGEHFRMAVAAWCRQPLGRRVAREPSKPAAAGSAATGSSGEPALYCQISDMAAADWS